MFQGTQKSQFYFSRDSGVTIFFGGGGIDGAKCDSEGAKFKKKYRKWLILAIFSSDGGKWGEAEPPTGGGNAPHAPLDAATE